MGQIYSWDEARADRKFTRYTKHDPDSLRALVRQKAQEMGIDPDVAEAVLKKESGYGQNNYNETGGGFGARGPLQIRKPAAEDMGFKGDPEELFDPNVSVPLGLGYLKKQIDKFGDVRSGLAAYYAGAGNISGGQDYAADVLGGGEGGTGGSDFGSMIPGLAAAMKWIQAGQADNTAQWDALGAQADQAATQAGAGYEAAAGGLAPEAIQSRLAEIAPRGELGADVVERLFGNLATALTNNPMFAQAAIGTQRERDLGRREEIVRQNIASYQRAGERFEKAGNYAQAVKMKKLELAERQRQDQLQVRAELAKEGVKQFGESQREYAKLGIKLNDDGTLELIKGMSILSKGTSLEADEWFNHKDALSKMQVDALQIKDKGRREALLKHIAYQQELLAATPRKGQSADQLFLQIQQMLPETPPDVQAMHFNAALEANRDMPGAGDYIKARDAALQAQENAKNLTPLPSKGGGGSWGGPGGWETFTNPTKVVESLTGVKENTEALKGIARGMRLSHAIVKELLKVAEEKMKEREKEREAK